MLLAECPEKYHSTSGALLVGNPWVETVRLIQLKAADRFRSSLVPRKR